jgi:hypothetical protein
MGKTMKEKIYISGKITGLDYQETFENFERLENMLIERGYDVVNPMKLCPKNDSWDWVDYMKEDLGALMRCNAIFLMDNWKDSLGARCEYLVAKEMGLKIYLQSE